MNSRRILMCCVLFMAVSADPTCRPVHQNANHIVCSPGNDDSILKRGLVSDNDKTLKLTLKGCRIIDIEYEAFHGLPSVTYIDLSKNKLSEIKLGAIDEARQVTHLNLSYNALKGFHLGVFDKKENVVSLDLKGNGIEQLELGVFDPLTRLQYLDLSSNAILGRNLNPYIFDQNRDVRFIDFSRNDMRDTNDNMLQAFNLLEFLNLDRCMLKEIPIFAKTNNLKTLKVLILSVNQISNIDPYAFVNLESLESLNIGWNTLNGVHEDLFKPLKYLKVIILRNNNIKRIPETLFQNMRFLSNIDMSNNLITYIPVNAFRGASIKNLNLANNRFTYLTDNFCLELKNSGARIQKFYFNQNPWQCKCLLDLLKEVDRFNIEYNSVKYDGAHPVCVSDEPVCKRHENFNEIYVNLYDTLITKQ